MDEPDTKIRRETLLEDEIISLQIQVEDPEQEIEASPDIDPYGTPAEAARAILKHLKAPPPSFLHALARLFDVEADACR